MTRPAHRLCAGPPPIWGPLDDELAAAPELAVLAALLAVVDAAANALHAAYPEIRDADRPPWLYSPAAVPHAARILRDAARLRRAVDRYRAAVTAPAATATPAPPAEDDILF